MRDPVYLIDGYGIIYRSYFAFFKNPLRSPDGRNASAVYGFMQLLFSLRKQIGEGTLAVAMDSITPTFRHEMYDEYKATREKTPMDLHNQIPVIESVLAALGTPCIRQNGYEADDVMATVAEKCRRDSMTCYLLSGDKDLLQLIGDSVKVLRPRRLGAGYDEWGEGEVIEHQRVRPAQIVDFLSLAGDSSDNVPGVPGIGEKTAVKLLAQFGSLDAVYDRIDEVKAQGQKRRLEEGRQSAFMSRELVTLKRDVPLDLESIEAGPCDAHLALELLHREGIKSFDKELEADGSPDRSPGAVSSAESAPAASRVEPGMYETVLDEARLDKWIDRARSNTAFAFDTETDSLDAVTARPIGFSLSVAACEACYVPLRATGLPPGKQCISADVVREKLTALLTDPGLKLIGQNIKYDYKVLKGWGIEIKNIHFDTMIAAWVLNSTRTSYGMDRLARECLNYETIHYTDIIEKGSDATLADINIAAVTDYAAEDADITYRLYELFARELREEKLEDLFYQVEMPNVRVLAEMELAGIQVDSAELARLSGEFENELVLIQAKIYADAGKEFNINSTKQLRTVLFEDLAMKPIKFTKTGASTDAQVLAILAQESTVCDNILRHRALTKLKNTYVDTLPQLINPHTHRIHTTFAQTGTATGRISSRGPNLQNIPVRTTEGRMIRTAFTAPEGSLFLSADYSQIELVVLAHLSQDSKLIHAFSEDRDIHALTASLLYGTPEDEVTPEMRRIGKTINFGVIYGMSAFRLSRDLKIPRKEADTFIDTYFETYQGVDSFIKQTIAGAEERGYVETIFGRRRYLPRINSRNKTEKSAEERIAVNTPIQGSAADIMKKTMIAISGRLNDLRSRLILQVHDELIFEVVEDERQEVERIVQETMESAAELSLSLKVNLEWGGNWGQIH